MRGTKIEKIHEQGLDFYGSVEIFGHGDNPRALSEVAPKQFIEKLHTIPAELLEKTEEELEVLLENPSPTLHRLRISFWHEYSRALEMGRQMTFAGVYGGICHRQFVEIHVLRRPERIAFIICPPTSYALAMQEALRFSVKRVREILSLPIVDKNTGKVDAKLAALMVKAMQLLDERINGLAVQKIESKSLNVNMAAEKAELPSATDIDERIKELQKSLLPHLPQLALDEANSIAYDTKHRPILTNGERLE